MGRTPLPTLLFGSREARLEAADGAPGDRTTRGALLRSLHAGVLALLVACATAAFAEPPSKAGRVGVLLVYAPCAAPGRTHPSPYFPAFLAGLAELGHVEQRTYAIECRSADGHVERLPKLAAELIGTQPEVIWIPLCGELLDAVRGATHEVPIVVGACSDDVQGNGAVNTLLRPGGNVTGMVTAMAAPEAGPTGVLTKQLEMLRSAVPHATRIAVLWDSGYSRGAEYPQLRAAAKALGLALVPVEARGPNEWEAAFATAKDEGADAMLAFGDPTMSTHGRELAELAERYRLPASFNFREPVYAGGLMSYGASLEDLYRRSAGYVDKILKGAKPGDLPMEQPRRFELVVNLKAARTIGLEMPQSLLVRADEVIE